MATNRYNNDISQLRQQSVFGGQPQQNMTRGVLQLADLVDRGYPDPDYNPNWESDQRVDHSGDSWKPADANPPAGNFDPITTRSNDTNKGGITSTRIEDLVKMTNQIYTPETRAGNRYNDLLDNVPERNKPGLMRALVAGTTAFGANAKGMDIQNISDRVMYSPYIRDMAEWKEKTGPYQQAATLENSANNIERQLAGNLVNNWTTGERNAETARYNERRLDETTRANQAKEEISRIRALAYDWKQRNPNLQWNVSGPTALVFDPVTGKTIDTKLQTGKMDEETKAYLQHGFNTELQGQRDTAAMERTDANNTAAQTRVETAGKNAVTTKQTVPGVNPAAASARPPTQLSPTQQKQERANRQQQVYDENPDLQEFFDLNPDNTVSLIPPIDEGWGIPNFMGMGSNSKEKVMNYWRAYKMVNPGAAVPREYDPDFQPGGSKAYKYQEDTVNPNIKRRTINGIDWEITHDNGKTWMPSRDR